MFTKLELMLCTMNLEVNKVGQASCKSHNNQDSNDNCHVFKGFLWQSESLSYMWKIHAEEVMYMTEHVKTRAKVKKIPRVSTFNQLLDDCMISPEEKTMMRLYYIEKKDLRYIGDQLGYTEVTMKRWHKKILQKVNKLL